MDLGLFATQVTQGNKTALSSNSLLGGNGLFGGAGSIDFWNIILGQIEEEGIQVKTENSDTPDGNVGEKIKKEKADLALLQLALLGQDPDKNLDEKLAELRIERINDNRNNRVEQLTKLIKHLTGGLPAATEGNGNIEELVARLERRLERLESRLEAFRTGDFGDEGQPFQLLIATGLNPAQLTKITQRIEEVETKLGRELTVEDLIAGVGNIIPAPGDDDHEFSTTDFLGVILEKTDEEKIAVEKEQEKHQKEEHQEEKVSEAIVLENDVVIDQSVAIPLAKKLVLQQQTTNKPAPTTSGPAEIVQNIINRMTGQPLANTDAETAIAPETTMNKPLPEALSNAEFRAMFGSNKVNTNIVKMGNIKFSQPVVSHSNTSQPAITMPPGWADAMITQSIMSDALGFDIQTGAPFNSTMQAAHAISLTSQAGQAHPATQTVAAHLTKAASNGNGNRMTLHLDPPELGRVEVRLEFGREKTVKAHLIIEKPETYLMLQRDAAALERALQNAGLETDHSSLDYQMAADDYAFNTGGEGRGNGGSEGSDSNRDGEESEEVIETTMSWQVDAETGHVRYNILA